MAGTTPFKPFENELHERHKSNCPNRYTNIEIEKGFPFKNCDGCPYMIYDDDEGLLYCARSR